MQLNYISKWGAKISLSNNELFWLTNVDGLTWSATDIASIVIGGIDGDSVNNIQAQPRGIVLDLRIKNDKNVEQAKRTILQTIKLKQKCTLEWTQNNRIWTIEGVVDAIEMPRFNNGVAMQISIHCGQPFWEDLNEVLTEINQFIGLHYFTDTAGDMLYFVPDGIPLGEYDTSRTRTFSNNGDVSIGMQIEVLALSTVTNPIIYDQNGNFFGVGYGTGTKQLVMSEGDKLVINTVAGAKSVTLNGVNELDKVKPQSTWLQLDAGQNEFSINSDDASVDNMIFTLSYKQRYI